MPESDFSQQEVTDGIHAIFFHQNNGINHVADGFGHFAAVDNQPAVAEYLLGQRNIQCHQHGGPDNCMETHDFLADNMHIRRPVFFVVRIVVAAIAKSGNIVGKCINPNIYNMLGVKVYGYAPFKGGTGNR